MGDDESEEEEPCTWDITWAWDSDLGCLGGNEAERSVAEGSGGDDDDDDDDEANMEWDITWEWQSDDCHSPEHELKNHCSELQDQDSVAVDSDGISGLAGFIWD